MSEKLKFFERGNERLIGRAIHDGEWQSVLGNVDQALQQWPSLRLNSHDVIFEQRPDGLWLFRSVIGFISNSVLSEYGLESVDRNQSLSVSLRAAIKWHESVSNVLEWASLVKEQMQTIDFPKEYGAMTAYHVRLKNKFSGIDELNSAWEFHADFAHGGSSIFAF